MSFKNLFDYKKRTQYLALYSVMVNALLALAKFILAYLYIDSGGGFFAISGLVNVFMLIARLIAYNGMKNNKNFETKTFSIFLFMIVSGVVYILYMSRLFYYESMHFDYPRVLSIIIAVVAVVEIILSIRGLFTVKGKGHFYRDIKLINLSGALLAVVLTQVSIISSFGGENPKNNIYDGINGVVVGILIILIAVFVLISPKISIVDRGYKSYTMGDEPSPLPKEVVLLKGIVYGKCVYKYDIKDDMIVGQIIREKSPWSKLKWYFKLLIIIFSLVIFVPYMIGAIVNYFIVGYTPSMLDDYMLEMGYKKV